MSFIGDKFICVQTSVKIDALCVDYWLFKKFIPEFVIVFSFVLVVIFLPFFLLTRLRISKINFYEK